MTLPANVAVVRVRGFWHKQNGTGSGRKILFTPNRTMIRDQAAHAFIQLTAVEAVPDPVTAYFYGDLIASNDPDLQAVIWTVAMEGEPPAYVITVPHDAPLEDVGEAETMKAIWLTAVAP